MNLGSLYISFSTAHNSIQIQIYYRVSYENCENCTVFPFFSFSFRCYRWNKCNPKEANKVNCSHNYILFSCYVQFSLGA